jgi:hypothetical protein
VTIVLSMYENYSIYYNLFIAETKIKFYKLFWAWNKYEHFFIQATERYVHMYEKFGGLAFYVFL